MKRRISILLVAVMAIGLLGGCKDKFSPNENAVYIKKDGSVIAYTVEDFSEDYYDQAELTSYIDEEIEAFEAEEEGSVKLTSFNVDENGVAHMVMKYDSCETYSAFNNVTLFSGSVAEAVAAGYLFDDDFYTIDGGESADASSASGDVSSDAVKSLLESKCVITDEALLVKINGGITHVSATGGKILSEDQARSTDWGGLTYIIY